MKSIRQEDVDLFTGYHAKHVIGGIGLAVVLFLAVSVAMRLVAGPLPDLCLGVEATECLPCHAAGASLVTGDMVCLDRGSVLP